MSAIYTVQHVRLSVAINTLGGGGESREHAGSEGESREPGGSENRARRLGEQSAEASKEHGGSEGSKEHGSSESESRSRRELIGARRIGGRE